MQLRNMLSKELSAPPVITGFDDSTSTGHTCIGEVLLYKETEEEFRCTRDSLTGPCKPISKPIHV